MTKEEFDDKTKIEIAIEALQWSYEMFLHRDIMNAQVHCAPLRLSPITDRTKQALEVLKNGKASDVYNKVYNEFIRE